MDQYKAPFSSFISLLHRSHPFPPRHLFLPQKLLALTIFSTLKYKMCFRRTTTYACGHVGIEVESSHDCGPQDPNHTIEKEAIKVKGHCNGCICRKKNCGFNCKYYCRLPNGAWRGSTHSYGLYEAKPVVCGNFLPDTLASD